MTITNFNYRFNYTQWTLVAQHPNLNKTSKPQQSLLKFPSFIQASHVQFIYQEAPSPCDLIHKHDTTLFYGRKSYNDVPMQADQKEMSTKGWAFPRRVYFNGNLCVMPSPESYPYLPYSASTR
ncbi:hypothetical protein H5410_058835 [Solanum commersonii]|uniref:COBRA C-terminal domain-containing protein n=1 Tax=Solanum commersonii TaxID=4109 RepID=A0A9J5W0Q8_SOLCO|nr:hypothetical protein H5410_058835 [Solanum commersonii]